MNDEPQLGDGPIEAEYAETMKMLAQAIDEMFNGKVHGRERKVGFIMMVFPFNSHEGRCNYISNGADRKDVVVLMKEQIARFEGMPSGEGHG